MNYVVNYYYVFLMWLFGWSEDRGWWVMVGAEVNGGDGGWSEDRGCRRCRWCRWCDRCRFWGGGGRGCLFRGGGYWSNFLCCLGGGYWSDFLCCFCWSYAVADSARWCPVVPAGAGGAPLCRLKLFFADI
ncbi:hypothetical protein Hdeb2414_s0002g00062451 [Helianthus debilis subsp. tardiflorus]